MNKKHLLRICAAFLLALSLIAVLPAMSGCSSDTEFVIPTRALVDDQVKKYGSYEYKVFDDNTAIMTAYTGNESIVTVPEKFESYTVVEIGESAFAENTALVSITFNKSLQAIGDYAFYGCTSLTEVKFNKQFWCLGLAAFDGTPWYETLTDEFAVVGDGVLIKYNGQSTDPIIPDNVKHVSYAFAMNYDVLSVEMGKSVLTIGSGSFAFCNSLKRVVIGENTVLIKAGAFDGCEDLTCVNIPDKVEVIEEYAFNYCTALPGIELGKSVRFIGRSAFNTCQRMKYINIPKSVSVIENTAFTDCFSLTLAVFEGGEAQYKALALDGTNVYLTEAEKLYPETEEK